MYKVNKVELRIYSYDNGIIHSIANNLFGDNEDKGIKELEYIGEESLLLCRFIEISYYFHCLGELDIDELVNKIVEFNNNNWVKFSDNSIYRSRIWFYKNENNEIELTLYYDMIEGIDDVSIIGEKELEYSIDGFIDDLPF